jgi:formamidopyrimidine-DNA glycosylase
MPELPEVETFRRTLERHAGGRTITRVLVRDAGVLAGVSARALSTTLRGRKVGTVSRHGKIVFADLGPALVLVLRFGMTGDLEPAPDGGPEPRFSRVVLVFEDGGRLAFTDARKFGSVALAVSASAYLDSGRVGPDALASAPAAFAARAGTRKAPIKAVLLDQGLLAGVGNLYADEALFQAGLHPQVPAARVGEATLRRLHAVVRRVLARAVALEADWSRLPRSWLLPVRAAGGPCPHCGGALRSLRIGGRTTVFCPLRQRRRA